MGIKGNLIVKGVGMDGIILRVSQNPMGLLRGEGVH